MKKWLLFAVFVFVGLKSLQAQRYAVVDLKYILSQMPEYAKVDSTLNLMALKWQKNIDSLKHYSDSLAKNFESEKYMLTDELKEKRALQVQNAAKKVIYVQSEYFGYQGELFRQRTKLVQPIQSRIYSVIEQMAIQKGWDFVLDKSAGTGLLYADPKLNKSNDILKVLGIKVK